MPSVRSFFSWKLEVQSHVDCLPLYQALLNLKRKGNGKLVEGTVHKANGVQDWGVEQLHNVQGTDRRRAVLQGPLCPESGATRESNQSKVHEPSGSAANAADAATVT